MSVPRARGRIGPLAITVRGRGPLAEAIASEMEAADVDGDSDLEVHVGLRGQVDAAYRPHTFSAKRHMSFNDGAFYSDEPVRYVAEHLFSGPKPARLLVDEATEQKVAAWRRRLGRTINASPVMSYALYWYVIHVLLLRNEATFIHAAAYAIGDRAYGIAGTGGSGKTSLLFEALRDERAGFLSEDFGILAGDRTLHYNPKAVSVYLSDLHAGSLDISGHLKRLPAADRTKWAIHRALGTTPMVKVPVRSIVDRIAPATRLDSMVYLVRDNGHTIRIEQGTLDDTVDRLVNVAWREQKRLLELVRMIRANDGRPSSYPSVEDLTEQMQAILRRGLANSTLWHVRVPAMTEPQPLLRHLRKAGCLA